MPRIRITHNYSSSEANAKYAELIHVYSYKPSPIIRYRNREADTALTIGCEVEAEYKPAEYTIEAVASAAQCVTDIADSRVYLKRDGSVSTGFEIVSHPATLAYHMYDTHWTGILNKCAKHGMRSHDAKTWGGSCGLHVHVGRQALGRDYAERDLTIRKVKLLVYRHWEEMVRFSRRSESQLERWASREISEYRLNSIASAADSDLESEIEYWICTTNTHSERYIAVNCENAATIEFRLFNGTLKRDTLIATMQLCNSICKYAMTHSIRECLESSFLSVALYERYNELETYLIARGLADGTCTGRVQNTQRNCSHGGADGVEG